jgi:putative metallohydrolase (TIGR04338 family)
MLCQQDQLYAAEAAWIRQGPTFATVDEVQQFLDDLRDAWWWEKWLGTELQRIEVGKARKGAKFQGVGGYNREHASGRVEFSTWPIGKRVVIHEITHVIANCRRCSKAHDPWFARIFLELVYLIEGSESYDELRAAFERNGIDYDAGGMTEWTPDKVATR